MPYRFNPVAPGSSLDQTLAVVNGNFAQLDQEAVVKTFKNASGKNGLIIGSLPNSRGYGIILNDNDGNPAITITVDSNGTPAIETLSSSGTVTRKTVEGADYYYDANGVVRKKTVEGTDYYYNTAGYNYMTVGTLPDGSEGFAVAAPGYNVSDGITP